MSNPFVPKVQLPKEISGTKLSTFNEPIRLEGIAEKTNVSFKDTMSDLVKNLNETIEAPDQILQSAVLGNGADVHDVMIAISKAELGVNIATQITTKVIQAYEKVSAIQV